MAADLDSCTIWKPHEMLSYCFQGTPKSERGPEHVRMDDNTRFGSPFSFQMKLNLSFIAKTLMVAPMQRIKYGNLYSCGQEANRCVDALHWSNHQCFCNKRKFQLQL
jgi:hypothetical protein